MLNDSSVSGLNVRQLIETFPVIATADYLGQRVTFDDFTVFRLDTVKVNPICTVKRQTILFERFLLFVDAIHSITP